MASMDESDGTTVDVTQRVDATQTLPGDDITVLPDSPERRNRRRVAGIVGAVAALVVIIGAVVAAAASDGDSDPVVATNTPTTVAAANPAKKAAVAKKAKDKAKTNAKTPAPTTPQQSEIAPPKSTPAPALIPAQPVAAPQTVPAATVAPTTVPAPAPTSVLEWTAPKSVTLKTGASIVVNLSVHNPAKGVVNIPRPLSCAPTLDNSEMCPQVTEALQPGSTGGAHWTVSAAGIKPGNYTLNFAGLVKIPVTVTA